MECPLKRDIRRYISGLVLLYLLFWGVASLRYENHVRGLIKQFDAILKQLLEKNPARAGHLIVPAKTDLRAEKGTLFFPTKWSAAIFYPEILSGKGHEKLQNTLVAFKDDLAGLDLAGIDLSGADLGDANLRGTVLTRAVLIGTTLRRADLSAADLRESRLSAADLSGATFDKTDLGNADLRNTLLSDADFRGVNFFYADLQGADLSEARLSGEKLSGADFRKVDFSKADLSGAVLGGARLDEANFADAQLLGADLRYADLSKTTGLKPAQLRDAQMDHNTRLPKALKNKIGVMKKIE